MGGVDEQQHQHSSHTEPLPSLPQSIYTLNPPSHTASSHQQDDEQKHEPPPLPSLAPPQANEENSAAAAVEAARRAAEAATAHEDGSMIPEEQQVVDHTDGSHHVQQDGMQDGDMQGQDGQPQVPSTPGGGMDKALPTGVPHSASRHKGTVLSPEWQLMDPETRALFEYADNAIAEQKEDGAWFTCCVETCGDKFKKRFSLKRHMKKHSSQRPFACDVCHLKFGEKSTLIRHARMHNGVRPFVCKFPGCEKTFADRTNVRRHQLCHTGYVSPFRSAALTVC